MFTDPESASALDASAPAAASDPAASAPARAASAGCNTKVIPVGSYSHSTCVQKSAAQPAQVLCATVGAICWLTSETLKGLATFCVPLSLQLMEITSKPESLNSSHTVDGNSEAINEMPEILCASFSSWSKLQTYFTRTEYLLLDLDAHL